MKKELTHGVTRYLDGHRMYFYGVILLFVACMTQLFGGFL
jgi:hypothetical protein